MTAKPAVDDMFRYIGETFEAARRDDEIVAKLEGFETVLKIITTDPDSVLIIDTAAKEAREGAADEPADATLYLTTAAANLFWQGKLNMLAAITRGVVKVKGSKSALVRVLPLSTRLQPLYIDVLRRESRDDLLVED